jgi:hypothetical protein
MTRTHRFGRAGGDPSSPRFDLLEAEILVSGDSRLWDNPLTRS